MKGSLFILLGLLISVFSYGQTTIWTEDFSSGSYSVTLGGEGIKSKSDEDYFETTDGSDINMTYVGFSGNFFAAQDIDDGGWTGSASPSQLTWSSINIQNYSSLKFSGDFASIASSYIDASDYVKVEYRIDGGSWTNLIWFENDGTTYNTYFLEDTDFDGTGDGTSLGNQNTASFTKNITGTGNSMDIRITVAVNAANEDFAFDNFKIEGTPDGSIVVSSNSITGFTYVQNNGPSAEQSYSVSATGLVSDLTITPPSNYEISTGSGASFTATSPITLSPSGGSVSSTTIYVRLKSGLSVSKYNNEDISHTSQGANTEKVTCNGSVTASNSSDIINKSGWTPTSNIDYTIYQTSSGLTTSNSVEIGKFTLRDGGGSADADALSTTLTDITFNLSNTGNLRTLAIFDASGTNLMEVSSSDPFSFNGISISASDGGSVDFSIRATFNNFVTDNEQFRITVNSVTADPSGSYFAASDAGGAATSISGDYNRVEVTATKLFVESLNPAYHVNFPMDIDVYAEDANGSRDLDATNSITLAVGTGSGSLSSASGLTQSLSGGEYHWTDVKYDKIGDFTIEAQCASLTNGTTNIISCYGDAESDIVIASGWSEPSIDYKSYTATSGLTTSNALEVARFTLRDGGSDGTDSDNGATIITDMNIRIDNWNNVATVAIIESGTNKSEVAVSGDNVSFSSITGSLTAADEGSLTFSIYATFKTTVTDNQNLQFEITNVTTDPEGSSMDGAVPYPITDNTGNHNKIIVTADRLRIFFQPSKVTLNSEFTFEIEAVDVNNNVDDDATNSVTLAVGTGTGSLSSAIGLTQSLSNGFYSWNDVKYNTIETFTIEAQTASLTNVTSNNITCEGSPNSDIIKNPTWSESSIDYASYNAGSGLTTSNSIDVAGFRMRDGGGSSDADNVTTTLTDLEVTIDNWEYIKAIAIFDGSTNIAEVTSVTSSKVTFSSISGLSAADDSYKDFTLFATFNSSVTDNTNLKFKISSATASSSGSVFAATDAGGAETDNTGTNNRIEVTATKLMFNVQPEDVMKDNKMGNWPTVEFVDANNNKDEDISGSTYKVSLTTSGTFDASATTSADPVSGVAEFTNLVFSAAGEAVTISATEASSTYTGTTSSSFDVGIDPAADVVFISEVSDASTDYHNEYLEIYNSGSDVCMLTNATLRKCNSSGTVQASWAFNSDLSSLGYIKVPPGGFLIIARGATSKASFESEWGALSSSTYFNRGTTGMSFGSSTQWRWQLVYDDGSKATQIVDDTDGLVGGDGNDSKQNDDGTWTTTNNLTNSNPGSLSGDDNLPVVLIGFKAVKDNDNDKVKINWQTASEINNDYFVVESSVNGADFEPIARIQGAGNSNTVISYEYNDIRNITDIVYYRLKQVDFDGRISYSKIISVDIDAAGININKVYITGGNIVIDFAGSNNSNYKIEVVSVEGKIIHSCDLQKSGSQSVYKIRMDKILKGVYFIRITNGKSSIVKRMTVL